MLKKISLLSVLLVGLVQGNVMKRGWNYWIKPRIEAEQEYHNDIKTFRLFAVSKLNMNDKEVVKTVVKAGKNLEIFGNHRLAAGSTLLGSCAVLVLRNEPWIRIAAALGAFMGGAFMTAGFQDETAGRHMQQEGQSQLAKLEQAEKAPQQTSALATPTQS